MTRGVAVAILLLSASAAGAFERLGVVAVADPPAGPDADLAELTHQLRGACRDRVGGVEDVPTMRARILGQTSSSTLSELDRAYGGALAVYQNGEFESALRTLHAIVEDLESLPETEDSYSQWVRANLRLAHTALTIGRDAEADEALYQVARTDLGISPEPDQYSPSYRRRFEGIKAKVKALARRRVTVTAEGRPGTVFVNGRAMGTTPLQLRLPAGIYRIGGSAGSLRVPSFRLEAETDDRSVVLDFALAESLRVNAGPGLALAVPRRGDGVVRAGAWLGVDRIIAVSRVREGEASFLLGSMYDVRRGSLLREGSVRMVAGSVPAANLGALAAFLLTGQSQRDVKDRTEEARERMAPVAAAERPPAALEALADPVAATPPQPPLPLPFPPAAARSAAPVATSLAPTKPPAPPAPSPAPAPATATPPTRENATPAPRPEPAVAATRIAPPNEKKPSLAVAPPPAAPGASDRAPLPPGEPGPREPRRWMRPTAWGAGIAAVGLGALAIQQGLAARSAYSDADALVGPGGVFLGDPGRYRELRADGDSAKRNAYLSAGATAVLAAAAGALGWVSRDRPGEPVFAVRF